VPNPYSRRTVPSDLDLPQVTRVCDAGSQSRA
jgi:hypothetical protein